MPARRIIVAITGASGALYGKRLLEILSESSYEVHLTLTEAACKVMQHELALQVDLEGEESVLPRFHYHHYKDLAAPIASGSFKTAGMVVAPCSMGTLARIATGVSLSLVERAADVSLKERRKLVLIPRETPLSAIHIENMLRATEAGAVVLPASPGFYSHPQSVEDLVDFGLARALDHLGLEHDLIQRYGETRPLEAE
jgi:4-hydroxy-3-polyprenylbenzoate decarboxylase